MVGQFIGGVNVFGGGLALYDAALGLVGAIGVGGDTSCADHSVAWRVRDTLDLDAVPAGVGVPGDNIVFAPASGFAHPTCEAVGGAAGDVDGNGDPNDVEDNDAVVAAHPLN